MVTLSQETPLSKQFIIRRVHRKELLLAPPTIHSQNHYTNSQPTAVAECGGGSKIKNAMQSLLPETICSIRPRLVACEPFRSFSSRSNDVFPGEPLSGRFQMWSLLAIDSGTSFQLPHTLTPPDVPSRL